jgi:hypothetical protein
MRVRSVVAMSLLVLAAVAAPVAAGDDEPMRLPMTAADVPPPSVDWYGMYLQGKKVGWFRVEFAKTTDVLTQRTAMHLDLKSMGQPVVMDATEDKDFDTTAPFAFRGGRSEMKRAGSSQTVEVTRTDHGFTAKATQGGQTQTPPVPAIDYTLSDEVSAFRWFEAPRAVGDRASFRSFSIDDLAMDVDTAVVTARKEALVEGVRTVFYEAQVTSKKRGMSFLVRTDAQGKTLSMVIGGQIEARLETEETATKLEAGGDLFVLGITKIDKPIGPAPKVTKLVVDVSGAGAATLRDAPRQKVARDAATGAVTLTIGPGADETATPGEIEDALKETVDLPTKAPQVTALAAQAVGDAKTPREKVDRLVHFVSKYVADVLCPTEPPVLEIIASRKGDCSEHSKLFAALARAAGIPTRQVGGLMYMGDDVRAFGGHAWDEVVLDGKWVPVDPTWDETLADAGRITLQRDNGKTDFLSAFGSLSLRLKEAEHAK